MSAADAYDTGDVVWGRPVKHNEPQARRKGVVLDLFGSDPSCGYKVWWYRAGDPKVGATVTLALPRELQRAGTVEDFSERDLARMERQLSRFTDGERLGLQIGPLRLRKRAARRNP